MPKPTFPFQVDQATLDFREHPPRLFVEGRIEVRRPSEELENQLKMLHEYIIEKGYKHIEADFTELELVNSAGLIPFIRWLWWLNKFDPTKGYQLMFRCNANSGWQLRTMDNIPHLAPNHSSVEFI